ncbi:BQ2448_6831 [Microbotryum intermedium]|uniref:BQ2448_6831 protein n=1 Tax=Microbotryum intermedium TaxID=269621 RepID=A0A238FNN6_9BASI|nr:BQ2448_6831 [Microbotryum intermedium]
MNCNPFHPSALTESVSSPKLSPTDDPTACPAQSSDSLGSSSSTNRSKGRNDDDHPPPNHKTLPSSDHTRRNRSLRGPSLAHRRDFAAKAPGMTRSGSGQSITSFSGGSASSSGGATSKSESHSYDSTGSREYSSRSVEHNVDGDEFGPAHMTNLIKGFAGMVITLPSLIVEAMSNATSASADAAQTLAQATSETTRNLAESTSNVVREGVDTTRDTAATVKDKAVDGVEMVTNSPTTRATLGHRLSDWFNWSSAKQNEQDSTVVMDESEILRAQLEQEIDRSFSGSEAKEEGVSESHTARPFRMGSDGEGGDAQSPSRGSSHQDRDTSSHALGERQRSDKKRRSMELGKDGAMTGGLVKPSEATQEDKVRHFSTQQSRQGSKSLERSGKGNNRDDQESHGAGDPGKSFDCSSQLRHSPSGDGKAGHQGQAAALEEFGRTAGLQYQVDSDSIPVKTQHTYAASSTSGQMNRPREAQQHTQEGSIEPSHCSPGLSPTRSAAPALAGHLQPSVWIEPHHEREEETAARSSFDDLKERFAKYPSTEASEQETTEVSAKHAQQPLQPKLRRDSPPSSPSGSLGLAADHKEVGYGAPVDLARSDEHGTSSTAEHDEVHDHASTSRSHGSGTFRNKMKKLLHV